MSYRIDRIRLAGIDRLTSEALTIAAPNGLAAIERAADISKSTASRWTNGERRSPLHYAARITYALAGEESSRAYALAAAVLSAYKQGLMPLTADELTGRFWSLLDEIEEAISALRRSLNEAFRDGPVDVLHDPLMRVSALTGELAAVVRELKRRGVDPREEI